MKCHLNQGSLLFQVHRSLLSLVRGERTRPARLGEKRNPSSLKTSCYPLTSIPSCVLHTSTALPFVELGSIILQLGNPTADAATLLLPPSSRGAPSGYLGRRPGDQVSGTGPHRFLLNNLASLATQPIYLPFPSYAPAVLSQSLAAN